MNQQQPANRLLLLGVTFKGGALLRVSFFLNYYQLNNLTKL